MKKWIAIMIVLMSSIMTTSSFSETFTLLTLVKTTVLTKNDANAFVNTFGSELSGNDSFTYQCMDNKCRITVTQAKLSNDLAEKLLKGRSYAEFTSEDKTFVLRCEKTMTALCTVIQKNALLPS